ncbi:TRAP transporter large permease [Fredinandcohnia onubensis]|uniref:TRAP transporter large permease n=1 Tax=Fredinandcohnia onubensis TaxID=1571209 RepID=UPI000C0C0D1B|nr:TRAP transporter large permease [Fredinandcohnia onubensis]
MSAETVGFIAIVIMLVLMMLRIPIAISMAVPAVIGILYLGNETVLFTAVESIIFDHSFNYTLSTIPLFILMGEMLSVTGISSELYASFRTWFGRLKGGLGMATIGASTLFAAASGSSLANTGTIGVMASKEMLRYGYSKSLTGGSIVAGGSLGILIPPSTVLIIYGMLTEQSIGKLLLAGIIPGIMLATCFIVTIYLIAVVKPEMAPTIEEKSTWKERFISLKSTIMVFIIFAIVIGGMFLGWFGPTEAAGIGAFSAIIIAMIKKKLTWTNFLETVVRTTRTAGFIYATVLCAFVFNYLLTISKVPILVSTTITSWDVPHYLTFLFIVLLYLFLGAVMDSIAAIVITIPFIMPIMLSMGHDLIWFGIIIVLLVEAALISPPYGMNILILNGVVPELKIGTIYKGALVFLLPILFMILVLYLFPNLALFIPDKMF